MNIKRILVLFFITVFALSVCKRTSTPERKLYRFIDNLLKDNIIESPLLSITEETDEEENEE